MTKLTELQLKLLEFYKQYHKTHRTHPTLNEAAKHFKTTRQTISSRAESLVNKGFLRKIRAGQFIHTLKKY